MRKNIYIPSALILSLMFVGFFAFFATGVNSASAYDSGCVYGGLYSTTTGLPCNSQNYGGSSYDPGCTAGGPYSTITGQLCGGSYGYGSGMYDPGCISGGAYSTITGQPCYGGSGNYSGYSSQHFTIGARGSDVLALQRLLQSVGFYTGALDGIYGPRTDAAFVQYQAQYSGTSPTQPPINSYIPGCAYGNVYSTITGQLCNTSSTYCPYPYGSTSYVGCPTYGYGQPTISSVSGPQSLSTNQSGTWTVNAYSPYTTYTSSQYGANNLTYSVNWGDQIFAYPLAYSAAPTYLTTQQSATFTHSYSQAGTYTAVFTVTNSSGQTAQTSLTVTVTGYANYGAPAIYSLSSTADRAGTQVTVYGTGFGYNAYGCNQYSPCIQDTNSPNTVNFGGTIISNVYSYEGTRLIFTVPSVAPGTYPVRISNSYGTSNSVDFHVVAFLP